MIATDSRSRDKRLPMDVRALHLIMQGADQFFGRGSLAARFPHLGDHYRSRLVAELRGRPRVAPTPLERRTDLNIEEFRSEYLYKQRPVVMAGAARDWACTKDWSLEYFRRLHGEDEVLLADPTAPNPALYPKLKEIIDDIAAGGSTYFRFYPLLETHPEHHADFDMAWLKAHSNRIALSESFEVFIAPKGSVTPLHCAFPSNLFVQAWGTKRWCLIPFDYTPLINPMPMKMFYRAARDEHGKHFNPFANDLDPEYQLYEHIQRFETTLEPGDVLFNPPMYWHAVYNPTDSIGIGFRWVSPAACAKTAPGHLLLDLLSREISFPEALRLYKKDVNLLVLHQLGRLEAHRKRSRDS